MASIADTKVAFDSVAKALDFAFNADAAYIAPPVMNRVMASVPTKAKKSRKLITDVWQRKKSGPAPQPGSLVRGLDRAAQAGFILEQVRRLDLPQQYALAARFTQPSKPCACGSPCCQGHRLSLAWKQAIDGLCQYVKEDAQVVGKRGKLGLSTEPRLRQSIVVGYYRPSLSMRALAEEVGVQAVTAAKHSELIRTVLYRVESTALMDIAAIFDQTGIVGLIE